ncbi:beta-lactoglobulin [Cynocephalus volans]|uniref:beta-lactoglobulin n=1 Tax=Cynocephalus volans TaxID=110931 RepID=UPI002FCA6D3B
MALGRGLLLLLALGQGLARTQKTLEEVPVQPGFDAQKVEGRWLVIRLAASRADLVSPADPLRLSLHSIWTRHGGDMELVLFWKGQGVCEGVNVTIHPTGLQGQYRGSFEGGSMHVCFVSTDYSNLILYVRFEDDAITSLCALLARRMFEDPQWLRKYLDYVERFHLQNAPVFNIDGKRCPAASSQR